MLIRTSGRSRRGFTMVEMMIVVSVIALLLAVAAPAMQGWISNTRVRTVAEGLQNGLRLAQGEAIRQNRQVVFTLTNAAPALNAAAADNGKNWSMQTVPLMAGEATGTWLRGGALGDVASGVTITGTTNTICFNSSGNQTANAAPGPTGAVCTVAAGTPRHTFNIALAGADRPLRVLVSIGGQVKMCDPAKTLSAANPDGCP